MKALVGTDIGEYIFDAETKKVTINGAPTLSLDQVLLIINISNNEIIYSPPIQNKGGTLSTNVITLDFDTTSMSDSDELQIWLHLDITFIEGQQDIKPNDLRKLVWKTTFLLNGVLEELKIQNKILASAFDKEYDN